MMFGDDDGASAAGTLPGVRTRLLRTILILLLVVVAVLVAVSLYLLWRSPAPREAVILVLARAIPGLSVLGDATARLT